ncbi:MAG: hypothetical protein O4861_11920 [Trichodesmium sp. St16_bin4-tuft]|nr:hypothetical protein [Trichodesmium sp. MAG_R01]MDE5077469.1 hypothetical protein [Trichodesmium sp. St2_bin6]MDE5091847.1 hypothetical protein [Trichodesmium sp. St18_bin3_1_1]MDE5098997.1 hypothetical protein [Trichodesmium sp. St16_bin4-tuft]MDE5104732.1 hypothetical protein [Trichodesmium sp. St19_bin2]
MVLFLRFTQDREPHALIMARYSKYCLATLGVKVVDNCTVCLNADNRPKLNALLKITKNG